MRRAVGRMGRGLAVLGLGASLLGSGAAADTPKRAREVRAVDQAAADTQSQARARARDVRVVNEADEALPVREVGREAREPFQHQFALDWPEANDFVFATYSVPSGKRLVVEYASAWAYLPATGQTMFVRMTTTAGGSSAFHTLALQKREDYGVLKQFEGAHLVRLYADPATTVRVSVGRVPAVGTANCTVTLSGYLVDVP